MKKFLRMAVVIATVSSSMSLRLSHASTEFFGSGGSKPEYQFTGHDSAEWRIQFHAQVALVSKGLPSDHAVSNAIESQINLLPGPMQYETNPHLMAPKKTHAVANVKVAAAQNKNGVYLVDYDYDGTIVAASNAPKEVSVTLAVRPERTFIASYGGQHYEAKNPCTDPDYPTQFHFRLFWSPDWPGCKLKEGVDYTRVTATLSPISTPARTLPEYPRLVNRSGEITMSVFFGLDELKDFSNPYLSKDQSGPEYRKFIDFVTQRGFVRKSPELGKKMALYATEEFEKAIPAVPGFEGQPRRILLHTFFGNTKPLNPDVIHDFHRLLKPALERDSLVVYSGHAGMGRSINLSYITQTSGQVIKLDPSKYQIFMFDNCNSYNYYQEQYFEQKKSATDPRGTRNLEIIGNGLESFFKYAATQLSAVVGAIDDWASNGKLTTYQDILAQFDTSALPGVVGDEDNPVVVDTPPAQLPAPQAPNSGDTPDAGVAPENNAPAPDDTQTLTRYKNPWVIDRPGDR